MADSAPRKSPRQTLKSGTRKAVTISPADLVRTERLEGKGPVVFTPGVAGVNIVEWARSKSDVVEMHLYQAGALLFRGFRHKGISDFEEFIAALSIKVLDYHYRSTPRHLVKGKIYTSTEYPANQRIPLHNENSYTNEWPGRIWFYCAEPAAIGGETPIGDSRRVYDRVPIAIRERFRSNGVLYVRNYHEGLDLDWQTVFQTSSRAEVEKICHKAGISCDWRSGNGLRTSQKCQAVACHPRSREMVWFNQAHLFHVSNLEQSVQAALLTEFKREDLPRNAYYGDGSEIEEEALQEIRKAYEQEKVCFKWEEGDILMLDNMLVAHGREPYSGNRRVLVGMADPVSQGIEE